MSISSVLLLALKDRLHTAATLHIAFSPFPKPSKCCKKVITMTQTWHRHMHRRENNDDTNKILLFGTTPPPPGTVTTRTTFLVGNPYKPSCSSYWVGGRFKVLYVVIMKYAWNALENIQCTMIIQT